MSTRNRLLKSAGKKTLIYFKENNVEIKDFEGIKKFIKEKLHSKDNILSKMLINKISGYVVRNLKVNEA